MCRCENFVYDQCYQTNNCDMVDIYEMDDRKLVYPKTVYEMLDNIELERFSGWCAFEKNKSSCQENWLHMSSIISDHVRIPHKISIIHWKLRALIATNSIRGHFRSPTTARRNKVRFLHRLFYKNHFIPSKYALHHIYVYIINVVVHKWNLKLMPEDAM